VTDRILRRPEVEARIGLSRSTIYEAISQDEFPKPIRIGKRAVGWPESVIAGWLAERINEQVPSLPRRRNERRG
jgi:prophage regulatory protein